MKKLLLTALTTMCIASATVAQVPTYVPSNGLIGWWPFNGDAKDQSINSNDGTVNGATLVSDRNGNTNSAYSFDGVSNWIDCGHNADFDFTQGSLTMNCWINTTDLNSDNEIIAKGNSCENGYKLITQSGLLRGTCGDITQSYTENIYQTSIADGVWHLVTYVIEDLKTANTITKLYVDGVLKSTSGPDATTTWTTTTLSHLGFGHSNSIPSCAMFYKGLIDDVGMWNRALTQQEITDLFNANTTVTGLAPVQKVNMVKVYPNPANDQITVYNGNLASVNGYSLKIMNTLGQEVLAMPLEQQSTMVNVSNLSNQNLYFIQIIDAKGEVIETQKIMRQ
jgi:hypothetical protein